MASTRNHDITTGSDTPWETFLNEQAYTLIDRFNDAEKPFRDMFAEQMQQPRFEELPPEHGVPWGQLAEAEHPDTIDIGKGKKLAVRTEKRGQALHFTQEGLERETDERLQRRITKMLDGLVKRQQDQVYDLLYHGTADGTEDKEPWYTVDDFGDYSFTQTHSHFYEGTQALFESEGMDHPWDGTAPQTATRHLNLAADHFRHHDRTGPYVALVGRRFARRLKDELDLDNQAYQQEARSFTAQSILDLDLVTDNVRLLQTPWMTGDQFIVTQVNNDSPIKYYEEQPVRLTGPTGAPVRSPGDLIGGYGHVNYGMINIDPLGALVFDPSDGTPNFV